MSDRPGSPPPGHAFEVDAKTGVVRAVPVAVGPDERIRLPDYAQWRRALLARVGDGSELFDELMRIVRGESAIAVYPLGHEKAGEPILVPKYSAKGYVIGHEELVVTVPAAVRLAAARELLDRAFGKPVQVVLDATPPGQGDAYAPARELDEKALALARALARERMLGPGPTYGVEDEPEGGA